MLFSAQESQAWLRILEPRLGGPAELRRRLFAHFTGFLVYHAARPVDVDAYYKDGLRLGDRVAQLKFAHDVFLSGALPELSDASLREAADELGVSEDGRAFVSLDARGFLDGAGHYLIYGSEYLCGLAARLTARYGRDYRQILKQFGVPTIFELELPFNLVSGHDVDQFVEIASRQEPTRRRRIHVPEVDFTFRLRHPLPPEYVLSHSHPEMILDPLLGMSPYRVDAGAP